MKSFILNDFKTFLIFLFLFSHEHKANFKNKIHKKLKS